VALEQKESAVHKGEVSGSLLFALLLVVPTGCGDDDDGPYRGEQTGQACSSPAQCYPNVAPGALSGPVVCMTRVENGYCTHECSSDSDCCAVAGECATGLEQVCSPFESTDDYYCFLSCEDADVRDGARELSVDPNIDPSAYCQRYAHPAFNCRSSGGGSDNRKICVP
jgi:hypothetical protein